MFDLKKIDKNHIALGVAAVAILVTVALTSARASGASILSWLPTSGMSEKAIAQNSLNYVNTNMLQAGQTATLVKYSETSGLIKITLKIGTSSFDSYATTDGKLFFPEAFDMTAKTAAMAAPATPATTAAAITPANVKKVANTSLQAFVVSSCPFGLQMQRALAFAIQQVPALANYVTVRYIGAVSGNTITSMHGDGEAQENLRQMCIRQEQPDKYWPYVSCYMQTVNGTMPNGMPLGNNLACDATAGIDTAKLNACVSDPSRGLAYAAADFALDAKYNVTGSPTLVLNGQVIDETPFGGRSSAGMLAIICDSSTNPPAFCSDKLNTTQASTSFSLTYAPAATAATGTTANTNCAPAAN